MIDSICALFKRKSDKVNINQFIANASSIFSKSMTLEDYVSYVNKNLDEISASKQRINVVLYVDQLFQEIFPVPDLVKGLKEANTLFMQTFNASFNYKTVAIKNLYLGNYSSGGISEKEGEIFKEYSQYKFLSRRPINVYLTHIPFVEVSNCAEESVGIAQIGYPYAVINSNATPERFHVAFLHELSHCLNARHVTDPGDIMYEIVSKSANHWDTKNISLIKDGIISQIKYGEANDWFF